MTKNNRLFLTSRGDSVISCTDQKMCKKYLGEVEPDKYIELFGEVPDA